jgi:uncharacterized protein (UPF0332 family)
VNGKLALHDELLVLASSIANLSPRDAALRRAVSTAYYALFHLLSEGVAEQVSPANPAGLRDQVRRVLKHETMHSAASAFGSTNPAASVTRLLAMPISEDLKSVALAFKDLQQSRYEADYDLRAAFEAEEVSDLLDRTSAAFLAWKRERNTDNARLFLASPMFYDESRFKSSSTK